AGRDVNAAREHDDRCFPRAKVNVELFARAEAPGLEADIAPAGPLRRNVRRAMGGRRQQKMAHTVTTHPSRCERVAASAISIARMPSSPVTNGSRSSITHRTKSCSSARYAAPN